MIKLVKNLVNHVKHNRIVFTTDSTREISLVKARLREEGISCRVDGSKTPRMTKNKVELYIKVKDESYDRAKDLIKEFDFNQK